MSYKSGSFFSCKKHKANREGLMHFKYVETYIVAAVIYIVIVLVVAELLKILEQKVSVPGLGLRE